MLRRKGVERNETMIISNQNKQQNKNKGEVRILTKEEDYWRNVSGSPRNTRKHKVEYLKSYFGGLENIRTPVVNIFPWEYQIESIFFQENVDNILKNLLRFLEGLNPPTNFIIFKKFYYLFFFKV